MNKTYTDMQKEFAEHYQRLFDFFANEHGLILTAGEMDDIINEVLEHEKQRLESKNPLETIISWRKVEDELPDEHEDVLVYFYLNKNSKFFPERRFVKESCFYNGRFECKEEVTHWANGFNVPKDN